MLTRRKVAGRSSAFVMAQRSEVLEGSQLQAGACAGGAQAGGRGRADHQSIAVQGKGAAEFSGSQQQGCTGSWHGRPPGAAASRQAGGQARRAASQPGGQPSPPPDGEVLERHIPAVDRHDIGEGWQQHCRQAGQAGGAGQGVTAWDGGRGVGVLAMPAAYPQQQHSTSLLPACSPAEQRAAARRKRSRQSAAGRAQQAALTWVHCNPRQLRAHHRQCRLSTQIGRPQGEWVCCDDVSAQQQVDPQLAAASDKGAYAAGQRLQAAAHPTSGDAVRLQPRVHSGACGVCSIASVVGANAIMNHPGAPASPLPGRQRRACAGPRPLPASPPV